MANCPTSTESGGPLDTTTRLVTFSLHYGKAVGAASLESLIPRLHGEKFSKIAIWIAI